MSIDFAADVLTARPDLRWQDQAACHPSRLPAQVSADDFFAGADQGRGSRSDRIRAAHARAVAVCRVCPVIDECRKVVAGMLKVDRYGVWAGQVFRDHDRDLEEAP